MKNLVNVIEGFFANTGSRNPLKQLEEFFLSPKRKGELTPIPQKHREADELTPVVRDIMKSLPGKEFSFEDGIYGYSFIIPREFPTEVLLKTYDLDTHKQIDWKTKHLVSPGFDQFCNGITTHILDKYWMSGNPIENIEIK